MSPKRAFAGQVHGTFSSALELYPALIRIFPISRQFLREPKAEAAFMTG